jgi:hypothetical protein
MRQAERGEFASEVAVREIRGWRST